MSKAVAKNPEVSDQPIFKVTGLNAFGTRMLARHRSTFAALARLESRFLADAISSTDISRPIFVCGLARSGTTVLLELLAQHSETMSQRYLDYPFVFTPYWWNRYLGFARREESKLVERSHKDGLMVSAESPEAMEEPLWMQFFPQSHDASVSNILSSETSNAEFEEFYRAHMAKLLAVHQRGRYLAKGNYHLARIGYLNKLFPQARFIIPIRDPVSHIASSIKQHRLFTKGQEQSEDARMYLQQIGHFEFGQDRTPINVDDQKTKEVIGSWRNGDEVEGWARYWAAVHTHLAEIMESNPEIRKQIILVPYEAMCQRPSKYSEKIRSICELEENDQYSEWALKNIKPQTYYKADFSSLEIKKILTVSNPALKRLRQFELKA